MTMHFHLSVGVNKKQVFQVNDINIQKWHIRPWKVISSNVLIFSYSQIDKYLPVINSLIIFYSAVCPSVHLPRVICLHFSAHVYLSVFRYLSVHVQMSICPCSDVYLSVFRCLSVGVQMSICISSHLCLTAY